MVTVHLTRHLYSFFPSLAGNQLAVEASTVGEVVQALEVLAPGIGFYICDERGCLRTARQRLRRQGARSATAAGSPMQSPPAARSTSFKH